MFSTPAGEDVARTVRNITVGARWIGVVWLAVLGVAALVPDQVASPGLVVAIVGVAVGWAVVASLRHDGWLVVGDTAIATLALLGPDLAGAPNFYGGLPGMVVAIAASRRRSQGFVVAALLSVVVLLRPGFNPEAQAWADSVGQLIVYLMLALTVGWAVHTLYAGEAARRAAEEARARAEERARTSAHLHDSVLQTLALIQRHPSDPVHVATLARRQERELREWLYGSPPAGASGLTAAVQRAAEEVERRFGTRIDVVAVGDALLDDRGEALVQAGREAMINAAKHAQVDEVSVYLEAEGGHTSLFVRDRGRGFDRGAVATDRHGLRDSIERRMVAVGGTATVRSSPGAGTEVRLEVS
jgi:signal transduction histidine kinase